jgi:hypothetical protein
MVRLEQALAVYAQAISLDPDSLYTLHGHGRMNEMLGNHRETVSSYERMISVSGHLQLKPSEQQALRYARDFLARNKARPSRSCKVARPRLVLVKRASHR